MIDDSNNGSIIEAAAADNAIDNSLNTTLPLPVVVYDVGINPVPPHQLHRLLVPGQGREITANIGCNFM